jgi:hypothetical protein
MEESLHRLLGDRITLTWLTLILGFCWIAYIPAAVKINEQCLLIIDN